MKQFCKSTFVKWGGCGFLLLAFVLGGCSSPPVQSSSSLAGRSTSDNPGAPCFQVGETVVVDFSGTANQIPEHSEPIKEDGTITLPYIGPVQAAGKTPGELQNEIHNLYVPKYYVRLTVTVKAKDWVYYVGGEVNKPGPILYVGETTVTKAIQAAGDFTDFANRRNVLLIRANGKRIWVNCNKAFDDPSQDLPVYPGDQIQVPRRLF